MMNAAKPSLTAELLLLAIDPAKGGLYPRRRRRFRQALTATYLADRGGGQRWPWAASRARRKALTELRRNGTLEPPQMLRRLRLADRSIAARRFDRLRRCIRDDEYPEPRDRELLLLLAWSGVLAQRSTKVERRLAARRLRKLGMGSQLAALMPQASSIAALACADLVSAGFGPPGGFGGGGGGGGGDGGAAAGGGGGGGCGGDGGC